MSSLYVPLHKRSISSESASRSPSPSSSSREPPTTTPIYTIPALLALAHSPSSTLPPQKRDALRAAFPELITNRKQRKAIEYHNHIAAVRAANTGNNNQHTRRVRPFAQRTPPAERKRNATRVLDEVSWRGRVPPRAVPVPVARAVAAAA